MGAPLHVAAWVHHGLGDVIMAVPMLVSVDRRLSGGSRLTLLVKSSTEERLLRLIQWRCPVDYVNLSHYGAWNYRTVLRLGLMLRSRRPDVFIAPHASSGPLPPLFARLVGAPVSIGPQGSWWRLGFGQAVQRLPLQHKVEHYADFARRAGLYTQFDARIPISIDAERVQAARDLLAMGSSSAKRWIVLAPGSGPIELHKRWPLTHYRELIQRLTSDDSALQIALLGSPSEMPLLEDLAAALSPGRALVIAQPDVALTLALIRHAAVLVCGCTGAGHMAALVGTPIVGIYGPTNPSFTGPFTPWLRLVRRGYACSPCYRRGFEHGCGSPICMTDIAVDQVFDAVRATLRGEPFPKAPQLSTTNATHPAREAKAV